MSGINKSHPLHIVKIGSGYGRSNKKRTLRTQCEEVLVEDTPDWGNAIDISLAYVGSPVDYGNWCHRCVLSLWDFWSEEGKNAWRKLGVEETDDEESQDSS